MSATVDLHHSQDLLPVSLLSDNRTLANLGTAYSVQLSEPVDNNSSKGQREIQKGLRALEVPIPKQSSSSSTLTLTLELNRFCNFSCLYCYQHGTMDRQFMSNSVLDASITYALSACDEGGFNRLLLRLIGGEPLLRKQQYLSALKRYQQACERAGLTLEVHVDTNGNQELGPLFQAVQNLSVSICLSLPSDHNTVRSNIGHDTATKIFDNISAVKPLDAQILTIIYNTHHKNINQWKEFLSWIEPLRENPIHYTYPSYIDNYQQNSNRFVNLLSRSRFSHWLTEEAIPELLDRGWVVPFQLIDKVELCQGHQPYSCKIYRDGSVTICDAMPAEQSLIDIFAASTSPSRVNLAYQKIKSTDPLATPDCRICPALAVCGGRKWCQSASHVPSLSDPCFPGIGEEVYRTNRLILDSYLATRS